MTAATEYSVIQPVLNAEALDVATLALVFVLPAALAVLLRSMAD
jgi:hypothetical protein